MPSHTPPLSSTAPVPAVRPASGTASAKGMGERERIARLLVAGYVDTPQGRWLVADRDERLITYAALWPRMIGYALHYGHVDVAIAASGAVIGVAVWFDTTHPGDPTAYRQYLVEACAGHTDRFLRLDEILAAESPTRDCVGSGWRLAWLVVARAHRGRGVAGGLLRYRHGLLDAHGTPSHLVADTPRARDQFAVHGYRVRRAFDLPDGPAMWSMRRSGRLGTEPGDGAPAVRIRPARATVTDPGS